MNFNIFKINRMTWGILIALMSMIIVFIVTNIKNTPKEGSNVDTFMIINGLDTAMTKKDSSKNANDYIQRRLYEVVSLNTVGRDLSVDPVSDFKIRKNSFKQINNEKDKVQEVYFIIDSKDLKQSYEVNYQWAAPNYKKDIINLKNLISCVPKKDIIFQEFNCIDPSLIFDWKDDVVYRLRDTAPFDETYRVAINEKDTNMINIIINDATSEDQLSDINSRSDKAQNQVVEWVESIGGNPDDYQIIVDNKLLWVY